MPNKRKVTRSSSTVDDNTLKIVIKLLKKTVILCREDGCWISKLKVNGRGHVQIKHKGIKYLGHRIMACARTKPYKYVAYNPKTKIEASHLCGNQSCINPNHLFMENCLINQTRDCCRMFGKKAGYQCPHEPPCIGCEPIAN